MRKSFKKQIMQNTRLPSRIIVNSWAPFLRFVDFFPSFDEANLAHIHATNVKRSRCRGVEKIWDYWINIRICKSLAKQRNCGWMKVTVTVATTTATQRRCRRRRAALSATEIYAWHVLAARSSLVGWQLASEASLSLRCVPLSSFTEAECFVFL